MKHLKKFNEMINENLMDLRKAIEYDDTEYIKNWCYTSKEVQAVCDGWRVDCDSVKELAFQLINAGICDASGILSCLEEVLDAVDAYELTPKEACIELGRNSGMRSQFFHDIHTEDLVEGMDFSKINL